ncbi:TRAP transporter fused permease subunit [uncultured Sphaerochaeta sp.]|uniref:TRAP transporter permease n=1 Tax=uncultured Sphaerochaeta sp. TaxID=886478 RepID=UPI002A0A18E4|nr:TRAP transporter fused permease subunit [uncultured Sphaerochaeta sp.]
MGVPNFTGSKKRGSAVKNLLLLLIFIAMPLFHMWTASFGVYPSYKMSAVHWAFVGSFILLVKPSKFKGGFVLDAVLMILNIFICVYEVKLQDSFVNNAGVYSQTDVYISMLAVILAFIIAGRMVGKVLPIIAAIFVAYAYLGRYIPGMFRTTKFSLQRIAPYLYTAYDGLFGQTITVSAQFIYLFVLFGSLLELTGAGEFFVNISYALTKRIKGGPAQAAVFSSMLMGTINGSGAANVVTTGTFTIPLMKKVGFKSSFAGAVEAVSSSGGQIMPPVMGAVAFLMSEMTGIAYSKIALSAIIPAILYYATLSISVYFMAKKIDVPEPDQSNLKSAWVILKSGWPYLLPIGMLIAMLIIGYSAQRSAFFSILCTIVIGFVMNRNNMTVSNFIKALQNSVKGIAPIAAACFLAGIVMGIINLTGLGLKISGIIETIANGNLFIGLFLAMFTSLLLGMGLPTSAAYMILAVLVAPALMKMGASMMAAHLFILYFGALSTITPPVALSTFAAAGIAEANVWSTGKDAMKLACTGFVIPFVFVYNSQLLLGGSFLEIIFAFVTAFLGCAIIAASLIGWLKVDISMVGRILLFPAGIMLFIAHPLYWNLVGLILTMVVIFIETKKYKRIISA